MNGNPRPSAFIRGSQFPIPDSQFPIPHNVRLFGISLYLPIDMKEFVEAWKRVDRDKVALLLSVIPGAGHLYKHHYAAGFGLLIGGNLLVVYIALILAIATLGLSLFVVPLVWWTGVAISAHGIEDWHGKHQYLHPWTSAEADPDQG